MYRRRVRRDHPLRKPTRTNAFERDALVVLITKRRAAFVCEMLKLRVVAAD